MNRKMGLMGPMGRMGRSCKSHRLRGSRRTPCDGLYPGRSLLSPVARSATATTVFVARVTRCPGNGAKRSHGRREFTFHVSLPAALLGFNPNGVESFSPGLERAHELLPWVHRKSEANPEGVESCTRRTMQPFQDWPSRGERRATTTPETKRKIKKTSVILSEGEHCGSFYRSG